jgi:aminoglycoside phosphotransferase family enzyme/predicted kinase
MGTPAELTAAQQHTLVSAWAATLERECGQPPRHIETHISHVLLAGGHAYKIKKALATPFLDQRALAQRRHACEEELRLNRRLAPELYLEVVELTGSPQAPHLKTPGSAGPVLEVAVKMRAFDEAGLWDRLAARGDLGAADIDDLAAVLARFHVLAAVAPAGTGGCAALGTSGASGASLARWGTPEQIRRVLLDSLHDLQAGAASAGWPDMHGQAQLARLRAWEAQTHARAAPAMARRLAAGRVREGHGDLHLGNVARVPPVPGRGRCLVFDGIEFNDEFRWLDVMNEVAFMAMDLHAHGLPALAHRFVNAYLEASGDYDGTHVLDYYLVHRALVRAKVAQLRLLQARGGAAEARGKEGAAPADPDACLEASGMARRYLELAERLAEPRARALLITHGLSGSGKTTLTQGLLEAAGAVRVRADVERKRLAGLAPLQSSRSALGGGSYTPQMNEATQARLLDAGAAVLAGGWPVILDATFIRRRARDEARELAARLGVKCLVLRFSAPPQVLQQRVRQRQEAGTDASEADEAVLLAQQQTLEPLQPDEMADLFEVDSAAAGDGAVPQVDWTPLLARLA